MKEFFEGSIQSQTETIDDKKIGRVVLVKKLETGPDSFGHDNLIEFLIDNQAAGESIARGMHGNSPSLSEDLGIGRGVSAYYSWDPRSESLTVEWGEVGPDGEAKLHTYLNRAIDLPRRHKEGMTIRSGHMSMTNDGQVLVCLLDSVCRDSQVDNNSSEYEIVRTLRSYGALVIGTDGSPIVLTKGGDLNG